MPRESREEWKIYKNVFDQFTMRTIMKLMSQKVIDGLESPIMIGKESNVFSALTPDKKRVIVKIYRLESCNFNKMYDYIRQDTRYLNLKNKRREIIFTWVQREFRNLHKAREAGVRVPTPIAQANNVLVLEYIGDEMIAIQLKDDVPKDLALFADEIIENLAKLYKAGLIHGDLSEFNILNYHDHPVLIDFSQGTSTDSPNARELMERDIKNLCTFLKKHKVNLEADKVIARIRKP
jgi:RIO kinase 1